MVTQGNLDYSLRGRPETMAQSAGGVDVRRTEATAGRATTADPQAGGPQGAMFRRFQGLSLLKKTMLANSAVVLLGAIAGTYITRRLAGRHSDLSLVLLFFTTGAVVTILVNYLAFWDHFRPLVELSRALEAIRKGQEARSAIRGVRSSGAGSVVASVIALLDRIEDDSLHVTARLLGSIESDRKRIGRELHDDTSQVLAAALLSLGVAQRQLQTSPAAAQNSLNSAQEMIQRALDQLKSVIYDLRPAQLDELGLASALRWYVKSRVERPGLTVVTRFETAADRLPPHVETALYRVGQEALANAVKHSGARRLELALEAKPGYAVLTVFDDGRGFDLAEVRHRGLGLISMRERIGLLDGQFNIVTEPGAGTRVYALVPVKGDCSVAEKTDR
jgi:two-component system, NarL family, sensor histidine kinase UhpB